ncbi:hypothetical protein [Anaerocolumna xylanovorans]|uniref:Uncharacterized protein n=1 Tax=Anaerocolumna xylanovorans DSM 12503 TaxID=1121345 RepID=A0A1M7YF36_9FIRM|nr:hypothetical protein [Anaerocolumna xylanovorans]SHO51230.1 hypothetical protein SAMN02745217_03074 [Anaerocolumna xylanovorans DSM 12503]
MEDNGIPNSSGKGEENEINNPDTANGSSPPPADNNTENTYGDFGTGNWSNGDSYGYPHGATITSDYGYTYGAEDMNNSGYSYNTDNTSSYESAGNSKSSDSSDTSSEASSENPLKHMVDIMKAALPHLDGRTQESASLIIKTSELMDTLQTVKNDDRVSASGLNMQSIDIEALLNSIRNVCYAKEKQIIDNILNFLRMKNMFETYSSLSNMMAFQQSTGENQENSKENSGTGGTGFSPDMMEILSSMLTPEQKSTFDNFSMMFNMMQE